MAQVVEQSGVTGRTPLSSEVLLRFHEAAAKVAHPDAVDGHAWGKRILGVDQPAGQLKSGRAPGGLRKGGFYLREGTRDDFARLAI